MNATTVVHNLHDEFDIYIGRAVPEHGLPASKWGNPFVMQDDSDAERLRAIAMYREWILTQPELLAALDELQGQRLGCWCAPKRCHGDVLAELADADRQALTGTEAYYRDRALEYDDVYRKPERQDDLRFLEGCLPQVFEGLSVLEIAVGTGYWTRFIAPVAAAVVGVDVNDAVLDVARTRQEWPATVSFERANAFELDQIKGSFDAALVGFFWSHLKLDQIEGFVAGLAQRLKPSSQIMFIDNRYVHGSNYPVTKTDDDGNTYQRRQLANGSSWDVLKNFPSPDDLFAALDAIAAKVEVTELDYYWTARVTTRS